NDSIYPPPKPPDRIRRRTSEPEHLGMSVNTHTWIQCTSSRNAHEAIDTPTPANAANTTSPTNCLLRMTARGSGAAAEPAGDFLGPSAAVDIGCNLRSGPPLRLNPTG